MKTTHDSVLREEWYCEHCHTVTTGKNPPNECDVCGSTKFDNGLDLAASGAPLPVPKRSAKLQDGRSHPLSN